MSTVIHHIKAPFPEKALRLFEPAPYKVMHGGRGGSKSWDFVRAALILGSYRPLYILCVREFQNSMAESAHKLISDQIVALGFHEHYAKDAGPNDKPIPAKYKVLESEIVGVNGTRFVFKGIRTHAHAIKSMEGVDLCLVFEARLISHNSWENLLPTVRRDPPFGPFGQGSEVWVEFNPDLTTDYTYQYWVADPPPGTIVIEINWQDNPYFPDFLRRQKDHMKASDLDSYNTVWGGKTRRVLKGAIYAKELQAAIDDGRINNDIKYNRMAGVVIAMDLGVADMTSMWFMQQVGQMHNAIDFYENCGFDISHYIEEAQNRKMLIKWILLPHDAVQRHTSAKKTVKAQVEEAYPGKVKLIRRVPAKLIRINRTRQMFPRFQFHETATSDGVKSLTHYQYGVDDKGNRTKEPLHNWASHASEALGEYCMWCTEGEYVEKAVDLAQEQDPYADGYGSHAQGWMGQ